MSAIVTGILNALIGLILQILASALEFFADTFLQTVEFDFATFGQYLPLFAYILSFFKVFAAGWLSFIGFLFILKSFGMAAGLKIERSRIWQFVVRYLFFGVLAINSWGIMSFFYNSLVVVIKDVITIDASGDMKLSAFLTDLGVRAAEGLFVSVSGAGGAMLGIVKVLVILIVTVMLVVNFFKLISLFFVRYIRLVCLVALAPVTFGMAILEETKDIFNTYIRTFFADIFVFIMTAFFIQGYISVMSSVGVSHGFETGIEFTDIAYADLLWAFFALAYSTFAVQFDQFIASLGVNVSRGGSANGGLLGVIGASAMMLRQAVGHGSSGVGGIGTPLGKTFAKNWNDMKSAVVGGARAGFAGGATKGEAFAMGAMGAAKGFASTTNVAKAAAMTKDGSSFAEALNQKFDKRFAEMQDAAQKGMPQNEYDQTKKCAEKNGFDIDQQRARDAILNDMKAGNITPAMAQSKLAAKGLLREDEQSTMTADMGQYAHQNQVAKPDNMAEEYKATHMDHDDENLNATRTAEMFHMPNGTTDQNGEMLRTNDGMTAMAGHKNFPDGTKISSDGSVKFANNATMSPNMKDANGNDLQNGTMQHADGIYTVGNRIIGANGVSKQVTQPTKLPDGTVVRPNGDREINGGAAAGGTTIDKNGIVTHGNGAVTKSGVIKHDTGAVSQGTVTKHKNGEQTFSDGAVLSQDGHMVHKYGEVTTPDGTTITPQGDKIFKDGSVLHSNGDTTSNGVTKHKDGSTTYGNRVEHSNGSITYNDGHVAYTDGTMVDGKGNISFDNGNSYNPIQDMPNGKYVHPTTGDIAYANGSVSHTSGAVSNADGYTGRVNHADGGNGQDGTFSLGGTVYWANGTAVNTDRSIEFDADNSGVVVRGNTVFHQSGTRTVTMNNTTKVIREDGHTTFGTQQQDIQPHTNRPKFRGFGVRGGKR